MKSKTIIYCTLMFILFVLFLMHDKLGGVGILLGYFIGVSIGVLTSPPKNDI